MFFPYWGKSALTLIDLFDMCFRRQARPKNLACRSSFSKFTATSIDFSNIHSATTISTVWFLVRYTIVLFPTCTVVGHIATILFHLDTQSPEFWESLWVIFGSKPPSKISRESPLKRVKHCAWRCLDWNRPMISVNLSVTALCRKSAIESKLNSDKHHTNYHQFSKSFCEIVIFHQPIYTKQATFLRCFPYNLHVEAWLCGW